MAMRETPAPLSQDQTNALLEEMRAKLAKEFGVTVVHDANGSYGQAGKSYVTIRFLPGNDRGDRVDVMMELSSVRLLSADEDQDALDAEDK